MAEVSNRKLQWVTSSFFMMLCFLGLETQAKYGGGTGEPNNPYLIYTAEHLNAIGTEPNDWDKHFKLMADIDLSSYTGTDFNIIGYWRDWDDNKPFIGIFNGNSHIISNFTYDCNGVDIIGLFGNVNIGIFGNVGYADSTANPEIRDLGLIDPNINGRTGNCIGSLVGRHADGNIICCYVEGGAVHGHNEVGGLVGKNQWGIITNCHSSANVSGGNSVAGLVGRNYGGTLANCCSTGNATGDRVVGGLVGNNGFWGKIIDCYAAGNIMGNKYVGGLVGQNHRRETGVGQITNCYSVGWVTGSEYVGGLVGENRADVTNCYSTGLVRGIESVGGLVGSNRKFASITSSFWDVETSGLLNSDGGIGRTTAEMQTAGVFLDAGWDFIDETENGTEDIWWILEGQDYPRLWWQYGRVFSPYPQNGAVDIPQPLILSWSPGGSGLHHDVYFGEDKEAVANVTIESPEIYRGRLSPEITSYDPGTLKMDKIYYWRIDEVNEADPNNPWKGKIWSFTTSNFIVVDDFESYDALDNQIWYSWHDGLGYGRAGVEPYYPGNGTGSVVGEIEWIEETIVHDGRQSMTYYYDNNKEGFAKYSEAEKTLSYPRNWTKEGVTELSLWFRGYPAAGSFIEEPVGTYTMTGLGADIGTNDDLRADEFHFAYKKLTGAGMIVAKVDSIENTHEWAKAGLMIREAPYSDSIYAFMCITPSKGIVFQGRHNWGMTSFTTNITGIAAPYWVKLVRDARGNFTGQYSSDGSIWKTIGETQKIQMSTNVYIGLALTSHDRSVACEAKFSNVVINGEVDPKWINGDIGIVTNDLEPMYVAIANNTDEPAVVYQNDLGAAGISTWIEWVIPLQAFADQSIDLTDVNSIAIGLGIRGNMTIPGGSGKIYIDDIRLYQPRPTASNDLEVNVP